jgi:serine/threonine protein kinase/tetratricopeptide (TPR) repeat protein
MKGISPERWIEIESVLDLALDCDPAEQEDVVTKACGDDLKLRSEVMALLRASDKTPAFLDGPGKDALNQALVDMADQLDSDEEEDPYINREMGPYRLIRRLGRGGMGQVYLAVRTDRMDDRFIAIKIIRRGMDTDEILHRFRTERRILASLTHPNIARLLDGGSTDDGLSYFVMDYVDGETITTFCDRERLTISERLGLFEPICSAVHYAHQKLIVHRDIKPGNILVTKEHDVKLLDFGIAKFLDPDSSDASLPITKTGVRVMTPDYASPEQIRGDAVTTASDVYQLGLLLYELLTGNRPYDFTDEGRAEIEKIILEKEPEKPSTAITKVRSGGSEDSGSGSSVGSARRAPIQRLKKQLSGDLDRIVLMALRKDPDRRYQSADQFRQDIIRFRAGLPVMAQSDSWAYRAGKFVRRHKLGVAASAVVACLLITLFVLAVRFAIITSNQNREIQLALTKKDQVTDLMIGMFGVADPEVARGREFTARELLDRGAVRIEQELASQPDVQAEMLHSIGVVYLQLGLLDEAEPILDRALSIRRTLAAGNDTPELAESLYDMARWYEESGNEKAESLHSEALAMRKRLFRPPDIAIAESQLELGVVYLDLLGEVSVAETYLRDALEMFMELEGPESQRISEALSNLAVVLTIRDDVDLEGAGEYTRRALSMQRRLLGNDHPFVASNLHNLGALYFDLNAYDEAVPVLKEAISLRSKLYGERHFSVANSMNKLGQVYVELGEYAEAEQLLRDAIDIHVENYGPVHARIGYDYQMLGLALAREGRTQEARTALTQAVSIFEQAVPEGHPRLQDARDALGSL